MPKPIITHETTMKGYAEECSTEVNRLETENACLREALELCVRELDTVYSERVARGETPVWGTPVADNARAALARERVKA